MCANTPHCGCGCKIKTKLKPHKYSTGGGFNNVRLLNQEKKFVDQNQGLLKKPGGGFNMGQAAGIAGGIGVAASGFADASNMPEVDAQLDPVGALQAQNEKTRAQEKALNDGAATAASAINPLLGAAFKVGGAISSGLRDSNMDQYGVQKTDEMGVAKQSLAEIADPLSANLRAVNRFDDPDYSTTEKALGGIPMMGGLFTRAGNNRKRERIRGQLLTAQVNKSEAAIYAAQGTRLIPRLAGGGKAPVKPAQPAAAYSVQNPSPQAQQYYQNILPTMGKMTGGKYNETYIDPATGKSCQGNSCLAFANSALEVATGQKTINDAYSKPVPRPREMAYNPEFTRTSEQQGWVRVPLDQAKAGDRLQYWNASGSVNNGVDRTADLGGRNYIPGKYPSHMMVFGGYNDQPNNNGTRRGVIYNDGHEFENANRDVRDDISDSSYVAYRYIGVGGQPTNDPKKAVALNPATQHAKGGKLPLRKKRTPEQDSARIQSINAAWDAAAPQSSQKPDFTNPAPNSTSTKLLSRPTHTQVANSTAVAMPRLPNGTPSSVPQQAQQQADTSAPSRVSLRPRSTAEADSSVIYGQQIQAEENKLAQFRSNVVAEAHKQAQARDGKGRLVYHVEGRPEKPTYGQKTTDLTCIQNGTCVQQAAGAPLGIKLPIEYSNNSFKNRTNQGKTGYRELSDMNQAMPGDLLMADRGATINHMMTFLEPGRNSTERAVIAQDHGNNGPERGPDYYGRMVDDERGLEVGSLPKGGFDDDPNMKFRPYRYEGQMPTLQARKARYESKRSVASRAKGGKLIPHKLAQGGSMIADGALHSEKHGIGIEGVGKTGIPVMHLESGERAAEIERNELVLGDGATEKVERLMLRHRNGDKLAAGMAGKVLVSELKNNTKPSARYARRLGDKDVQMAQGGTLAVLGKDGNPTGHFNGNNRVMSQKHTRELVTRALGVKHSGHERNLGLRAFTMLKQQDERPTEYAKS